VEPAREMEWREAEEHVVKNGTWRTKRSKKDLDRD